MDMTFCFPMFFIEPLVPLDLLPISLRNLREGKQGFHVYGQYLTFRFPNEAP